MPVNYERAPWDKTNSLAVRLINQRLADNQRKAKFIDTFLHSPRVAVFYTDSSGRIVAFIVMHPSYPVITAMVYDGDPVTTPCGEITPTYKGSIHDIFDWSRCEEIELNYRSTDTSQFQWLQRYLYGQYQDSRGRNTLLSTSVPATWQSPGNYTDYLPAISLLNDNFAYPVRAEASWNLDQLWINRKFLLGREYEREPADGGIYYMPPEPANEFEIEDTEPTKSESYFPKLPGYHVDYIDSLGVFAPTNWTIDPITTQNVAAILEKDGKWDLVPIFDRMCVMKKGIPANNLQEQKNMEILDAYGNVPFVGTGIKMINLGWSGNDPRRFWPRLYAFGRQYQPAPSPAECQMMSDWYYYHKQVNWQGPIIHGVDQYKFADLASLLVERKYIKYSDVPGWI